ncbi:MAG: cytochrome c-type biogenesis protein CcmH, partial [Planctomycetota bacterium]
ENWSRTLSNCPDPCADEQKEQIRDMVARGASDEAIYGFMADSHGPKALSSPGWKGVGKWAYLLPPFFVLAGAVVATLVILHWRNQGELERERRESLSTAVSTGEIEQVERELEKLD